MKKFFRVLTTLTVVVALIATMQAFIPVTAAAEGGYSTYTLDTGTIPIVCAGDMDVVIPVTLAADAVKDSGYDHVRVNAQVSGPGTAQLLATDTEGNQYDVAQVGYWGPQEGFPISKDYSATTNFTCKFSIQGTYTITLTLVDMDNSNTPITSKEISIDVLPAYSMYELSTGVIPDLAAGDTGVIIPVTLNAKEVKDIGYNHVRVNVRVSHPDSVQLLATDTEGHQFDVAQVGYWGPTDGFPITNNYSATTNFTALFSTPGTHTITLSLVDIDNSSSIIAQKVIDITVSHSIIWVDDSFTALNGTNFNLPGGQLVQMGTSAFSNLPDAVKAAQNGDTIRIFPGSYGLNPDTNWQAGGQGGWYLPIKQDNLTLQGVDASGQPISAQPDMSTTLPLIYGLGTATNGSWASQDLVAVFGNHVTITGLAFMPKSEPNKTIEIMGTDPTIKYCRFTPTTLDVHDVGGNDYTNYGGSLYINGSSIANSNVLIEDNYFFETLVCFDSCKFDGSVIVRHNTFDTPSAISGSYLYMIGNVTWSDPATLDMRNVLIDDNRFINLPANYDMVVRNRLNGTFTLNANSIPGDDVGRVSIDVTRFGCSGETIYIDTMRNDAGDIVDVHRTISAPQATAGCVVDDNWAGLSNGTYVFYGNNFAVVGTNAFSNIQAAVTSANTDETIKVLPGTYDQGSYIILNKNGLTIQGVKADGTPITDYHDVAATVGPLNGGEATMTFHVVANDITIAGIRVADQNDKDMTINGDNFTLKNCAIQNEWNCSGAIYFYDTAFNTSTNKSSQKTFRVENNKICGWGVALTDGTGYGWPATGKVITGNVFGGENYQYYSIGFRSVNSTGWCNKPVGGVTITGNTFTQMGTMGYVYFDGESPIEGLDFLQVMHDNTFQNGAVQAFDSTGKVRIVPSTSPWYKATRPNLVMLRNNISTAISEAQAGDTIQVITGTYNEDVVVNKAITLKGAGADRSIISGPIGGSVNTLEFTTSGAVVDGFTITRDGNNPTDWNNAGLNGQGVTFSGNDNTLQNCKVYGNRNGVYINNHTGNRVLNCIIDSNRTGFQFCNRVNGTQITGNRITNNFTMGILFNFDGPGDLATNAPVTINNNIIAGNWYGEIKCRWTNSTQKLDLNKNWFGSPTITRSATALVEPGYASMIPEIFGGTATKPTTAPPIISDATYNLVDYYPWYLDEGMTTLATLDSDIWVDDTFAKTAGDSFVLPNGNLGYMGINAFTSIQDAVKAVAARQTIKVFPGEYPVNYSAYAGGSWYLYIDKDNVSITGVDETGTPITGIPNKTTVLPVIYGADYTPNGDWGSQSLMLITGDNFKLQGLEVMPKCALNKDIEISGDNSIIQYCRLSGNSINPKAKDDGGWDLSQDNGALYYNTDAVTKYTVDSNYLLNTCIAISNGAGSNGADTGRLITNNIFDGFATDIQNSSPTYKYTYYSIAFRGMDDCGWREKDIGDATIRGNSFINCNPYGTLDNELGGVYILSTGKKDGGTSHALDLNWDFIIANNTFNNGRGDAVSYVKDDTSLIKTIDQGIDTIALTPTISAAAARAGDNDTLVLDTGSVVFESSKSNITGILGSEGMDAYFNKGTVPSSIATKLDAYVQHDALYNSAVYSFALDGLLLNFDGTTSAIAATGEDMKVTVKLTSTEAAQVGDFTRTALVYYDTGSDSFKTLPCTYNAADKTLTFDTKSLTTYAVVKYTQERSFKLEPTNVNGTAAAANTGIGVPAPQSGSLAYSVKTNTLYAISGKATNMTTAQLGGLRHTTITVTSMVAPDSSNIKAFHWAEKGTDGRSNGLWIPVTLTWIHKSGNQYEATLQPNALNYGQPLETGAVTDGPFAFMINNAAVVSIDSVIKDASGNVLSNEMVQTITVNPEQNRSFSLETADVSGAAKSTSTSIGPVDAQSAGMSYTLQAGKLYAIAGKATNMTTAQLGGLRNTTITMISMVAPDSSNFKAFHWAERGTDGHSSGLWTPVTLTWVPTGGLYEYRATLIPNALNYGEALTPGQVTDGPFAFSISNPGTVTVNSIIKDASGNALSAELVQNININADTNSKLATLTSSAGILNPAFGTNKTEYKVMLDKDTGTTTLTAAAQSQLATIYANGARQNTITVNLLPGESKTVWFLVLAQDMFVPSQVYYIDVVRAKDDNTNLDSLSASTGIFSTPFSAGTVSYNLALTKETTSVSLTAHAASNYAAVTIDGTAATSKEFTLAYGETRTVTVRVTAQDGSTKDYTINIRRANFGTLKLTTVDSNTLNPFGGVGLTLYSDASLTHMVGSGVTDATSAVATFGGLLTGDYWAKVTSVPAGYYLTSDIVIKVSAVADKITEQNLTLDTTNMVKGYMDSQLKDIQVTAGTLSPTFDPEFLKTYTLTLDQNTSKTTITPVLADSASKLYINGHRATSKTVTLKYPGSTYKVSIRVQPKIGKSQTYYVTVVRSKSADAYLSSLKATRGTFDPAVFNKDTLEYTLNLSNTQSSTYITPKVEGYRATYSLTLDGKYTKSRTVSLKPGQTRVLEITVIAQDGTTKKTYKITIIRAN